MTDWKGTPGLNGRSELIDKVVGQFGYIWILIPLGPSDHRQSLSQRLGAKARIIWDGKSRIM